MDVDWRELEGWEMTLFSYSKCVRCGESLVIFDSAGEACCENCGAEYIFEVDDNGFLLRAWIKEYKPYGGIK
jgi:predicted RNA-binding Zn-ribbon protein involved in translation (DUF1610 family)